MKKFVDIIIALSLIYFNGLTAKEMCDSNSVENKLIKIVEHIKEDSTTINFLFKGDKSKIDIRFDSASVMDNMWPEYSMFSDFINYSKYFFDSTNGKTKAQIRRWMKKYDSLRKVNYVPVKNELFIPYNINVENAIFPNSRFDVIDNRIFRITYEPSESPFHGTSYIVIINEKNEIIYFKTMVINIDTFSK